MLAAEGEAGASVIDAGIEPGLRWKVSRELTCPTPAQLGEALAARFEGRLQAQQGEPNPGERALYLGLGPRGIPYLWLWEEPSATFTERDLPLGGASCKDVAEAVALLADTWLQKLPLRRTEERTASPTPEAEVPGRDPTPLAERPAEPAPPAPSPWALGFDARLGLIGNAGLDAEEWRVGAALGMDLQLTRWLGVGAQVEVWPDLVNGDPRFAGGKLVAHRQAASLQVQVKPLPDSLPNLWLLVGVRGQHVGVETQGYPGSVSQDVYPVGPWLGARYALPLTGLLNAFGQFAVEESFAQQGFFVSDPAAPSERLYLLPAATVSGVLGMELRLR